MDVEVRRTPALARDLIAPIMTVRQLAFCLDPENPEQTKDTKEKILVLAEQELRQIHNLEKLVETKIRQVDLEPVEIKSVCEEIKEEAGEFFRLNQKRLRLEFLGRPRLVTANRELLISVLYNLTTSAVNYSADSGEICLKVYSGRKVARFLVRDFGPIIPQTLGTQIFEKTLSGPIRIPLRPDVSGLGVYLNMRFLEMMGTRLRLTRHRDGMGFQFELKTVNQGKLF